MARVQRGNVVLTVAEHEVQRYLQLGYNVTKPNGAVLHEALPTDFGTLQKAFLDQTTKVERLESKLAQLTSENAELKKALQKANKPSKTKE